MVIRQYTARRPEYQGRVGRCGGINARVFRRSQQMCALLDAEPESSGNENLRDVEQDRRLVPHRRPEQASYSPLLFGQLDRAVAKFVERFI